MSVFIKSSSVTTLETELSIVRDYMHAVKSQVIKVIKGVDRPVKLITLALFTRGHVLLYGLPGQGKTLLANALARAIGGTSERFQGSPDFLFSEALISAAPSESGELRYYTGRLLRHGDHLGIVLLDEINRFMPNTQASFLEVMQERKVTTPTRTHELPHFIGIATQNPLEVAETYPLPEALRDRFMMLIRMGYPEPEAEIGIISDPSYQRMHDTLNRIDPVVKLEDLESCANTLANRVRVSQAAIEYIYHLACATRKPSAFGIEGMDDAILAGVSTRGMLLLRVVAQAAACWAGRDYVMPQDIQEVLSEVFGHRIFIKQTVAATYPNFIFDLLKQITTKVPTP